MKKTVISIFKYLIFLFIGIGLLWLVSKNMDFKQMWETLKSANYFWIGLAVFTGILSHLFRAIRWNMLLSPMGYKTQHSTTFYAVMIGYLANYAIPRIGEITRCGIISKHNKIPLNSVIGTVIAERVFDFITLCLIILLTIILQMNFLMDFVNHLFILPVTEKVHENRFSLFVFLIIVVVVIALIIVLYIKLKPRLQKAPLVLKMYNLFEGLIKGMKSIAKVKNLWLFLVYTVLIWLMYTLMVFLPFYSFSETSSLTFGDAITIMALGSLGIVAPIPGGIGSYHYIVNAIMVSVFKISSTLAFSFAILVHTAQTLMIIVLGAISYMLLIISNRKSKQNEHDRSNREENPES